MPPKKDTKSD